jgi:hypothetical protein
VVPLHAYAPQPVVLSAGQLPAPSQTAGLVIVPLLHDIARQVVSAPGILHVALVPSQLPAHVPLPPQAVWPVLGAPDTNPHVPGTLPLQYSHDPVQAELQQILSAQKVVMQSVPAEHAWPCFALQAPVELQVPVQRPFGSSIPVAGAQVWLVVSHFMQVPVQSLFEQLPVLGMHTVVDPEVHALVDPVQA